MKITKMHGIGNSQIIITDFDENLEKETGLEYGEIARALCHPGFGIGSDQALILLPSEKADYRMRIFNKDGGEAEMCGNGIRCVARYLFDKRKINNTPKIETLAGIKNLEIIEEEKTSIEVEMGKGEMIEKNKKVNGFVGSYISVGNPHFVIFDEQASKELAKKEGPKLEEAEEFQPEKSNIEFVNPVSRKKLETYVWERGAGLTLACGTGACAAAFAAKKRNKCDSKIEVVLLGGSLRIEVDEEDNIKMSGPAEYIFEGEIHDISSIFSQVSRLQE